MAMNKKGMYFTLMTVAILILFVFVFTVPELTRLSDEMSLAEMQIDAMGDFLNDVQRDTERGLFISSYRALLALQEHVITTGEFLNDTEALFLEAVSNGSIYNKNASIMVASTFPNWMQKIELEAAELNFDLNLTLNSIDVAHNDPWHITATVNLSVELNGPANLASWNRYEIVQTAVSIDDFEDPLYIVYGLGRISNPIRQTPYEGNFTQNMAGVWNLNNFIGHTNQSYYAANPSAPSFLMRFQNNRSSSPFGIESLVNVKKVADADLEVNDGSSIVDYYYWPDDGHGDYRINFTPSWYKIDNGHRSRYNLTSVSYIP